MISVGIVLYNTCEVDCNVSTYEMDTELNIILSYLESNFTHEIYDRR